jgi:hypothetical protein
MACPAGIFKARIFKEGAEEGRQQSLESQQSANGSGKGPAIAVALPS